MMPLCLNPLIPAKAKRESSLITVRDLGPRFREGERVRASQSQSFAIFRGVHPSSGRAG
jgi:hypothetical protein